MISARDFNAIATVFAKNIADASCEAEFETIAGVALDLSDVFAQMNPRFNRAKFLQVSGVKL